MADTAEAETPLTIPAFRKRTTKSSNLRKRPATPPPAPADSDDSDGDYSFTSDEGEPGVRIKRRKTKGVDLSAKASSRQHDLSKSTAFAADRSVNIAKNEDATRASNWNQIAAEEARSMNARNNGEGAGSANSGKSKTVGPVKAPANVRQITVTDFAPDVCKDYKKTGFCGFGDSCKYLHAREDYAAGWKLDKEWDKVQGQKKNGQASDERHEEKDDEEKLLENIPFKCIICEGDYKMPVVTKCGHYFCERCAMTRYTKEKKRTCANCGADTGGSFGMAKKLKGLLERKKAKAEEGVVEATETRGGSQ